MARDDDAPGDRLRQLRKLRGLSVVQIAARTGYSSSGVRAHENGQNGIRPDVAEVYAGVFKVGPDWILYGSGPEPAERDADEGTTARNFLRAWREFRGLTEAQLGARSGSSEAVVKELEAGNRPLSGKQLRQYAPALKTTEGLLSELDPTEVSADVLEAWIKVPEEKRKDALAMLRALGGDNR